MGKIFKSVFFSAVLSSMAVATTIEVANAVTEVTGVQSQATYQNGGSEIAVDGSLVCENIGDIVVFEAMQTQGRHIGVGVLEISCTAVETVNGPFTIPVFDGLKFRKGPFTLSVRSLDNTRAFVAGQGFQMKGK